MSNIKEQEIQQQQQQQIPKYLNLAHQFLDTNFIESTKVNKFNVLPIISTNPICESFIRIEPPIAVDYFSYDLTSKEYHSCWKNICNNQFMKPYELSNVDNITRLKTVQQTDDLMMFLPTTSQARLENACWRAWYKKLKNLKELNPTEINWFKENDVTVLYGPLIDDNSDDNLLINNNNTNTNNINNNHIIEESQSPIDDLFDADGDAKMVEDWNSDCSSAIDEVEVDNLLFQGKYNINSTEILLKNYSTSKSITTTTTTTKIPLKLQTPANLPSNKELKSILKKRSITYSDNRCKTKKRISFSQELNSIKIIV
jgi:hypothetical protein